MAAHSSQKCSLQRLHSGLWMPVTCSKSAKSTLTHRPQQVRLARPLSEKVLFWLPASGHKALSWSAFGLPMPVSGCMTGLSCKFTSEPTCCVEGAEAWDGGPGLQAFSQPHITEVQLLKGEVEELRRTILLGCIERRNLETRLAAFAAQYAPEASSKPP